MGDPKSWGEWLQRHLDAREWSQADFVRASEGVIKRDRASKWVNGLEAPSHRLAVVTANTLGIPRDEALQAAGYAVDPVATVRIAALRPESLRAALWTVAKQLEPSDLRSILPLVPEADLIAELQRRADDREAEAALRELTANVVPLRHTSASDLEGDETVARAAMTPRVVTPGEYESDDVGDGL